MNRARRASSATPRPGARRPAPLAVALGWLAVAVAIPAAAGTVTGTVRFEGTPPPPPTVYMSADPACDRQFPKGRPAQNLVVGPGGALANVIVHVKAGLDEDYRPPAVTGPASIDQRGCMFVPHVLGVLAGQEIEIHNGDETIHNVDARAQRNQAFNEAMPAKGLVLRKAFFQPEVAVKLKCDIHPWMSAYVGVFEHPFFAVTDADGRFSIPGLPAGEYALEAWHESLGTRATTLDIDEDEALVADFSFAGN